MIGGLGQALCDIAIGLAERGLPVFPCGAKKTPIVKRGFLDASTDPAIIRVMFAAPGARLIGVPTGPAAGFDVLDLDYRHGARTWEDANLHRLPETRTYSSQSGGRHMLFAADLRVRNSVSRIAAGVDVRGSGGYIIMPPSPGYQIVSDANIVPWPVWLLEAGLVLPAPPQARPARPSTSSQSRNSDLSPMRGKP